MERLSLPEDGDVQVYDYKEGARLIVDRAFKSQKLSKGRKERRRTYYDVIMSFDIETTKLLNLNYNPRTDPNSIKYFNITFCWQCSIDGYFIFGRDIRDFFRMLDMAAAELDGLIICYIHNIAYEFNNLCDYFMAGIEDPDNDIFFKSRSTPLYARYRGAFEFRCSKLLTAKGLAKVGKEIGYNKLTGDFDYNIQRDTDTVLTPLELNYCYRDVMILDKFIAMERTNYCTHEHKKVCSVAHLPFTSTGYVRANVQKDFSYKPAGKYILKQSELTADEYHEIAPALWGGYVHGNFRYIGKAVYDPFHLDIISAYPGSFLEPDGFPYALTRAIIGSVKTLRANLADPKRAVIAKIVYKKIKMKKGMVPYIPAAKTESSREIVENGKVLYAEDLSIIACDVDLKLIEQGYDFDWDDVTVEYFYFGIKKPIPYNIITLIETYFNAKTTLKGVPGRELDYAYGKAKLNAIFGMSGQALEHTVYKIIDGVVKEAGMEYQTAKTLPYQWAIYITAYTRRLIYKMITIMQEENVFIYSDTDSIFFKYSKRAMDAVLQHNRERMEYLEELRKLHYNIVPKNPDGVPQYLFTLDFEDCTPTETHIKEMCTIGAKRYYQIKDNGLSYVTFSGLRATKPDEKKKINGYNTQRLIDKYGSLLKAFETIKESSVTLPYVEGVDKMSNYNVRSDFRGVLNGKEYRRPCTYTLYPQSIQLSLNHDLKAFLISEVIADYE